MSDIIRSAIVKLGIQLSAPNLKIPDLNPAIRQQKSLADATRAAADANAKLQQSYTKMASGSLQMARGFTLLAGSQSETIQKATQQLFAIQGVIDISKGAAQVSKSLGSVYKAQAASTAGATVATRGLTAATSALYAALGPVGVVAAGVAAALAALSYAYNRSAAATTKARDATKAHLSAAEEVARTNSDSLIDRVNYFDTLAEKEKELTKNLLARADIEKQVDKLRLYASAELATGSPEAALVAEQRLSTAIAMLEGQRVIVDGILNIEKQHTEEVGRKNNKQIELVQLKERELSIAREALRVEEDKSLSLRASIGALNPGEQRKLGRLLDKAESGAPLSRKEAIGLQQLGGEAGRKIAERTLEPLGRELAEQAQRIVENQKNQMAKLRADFDRKAESFDKATGGKGAADKIRELQKDNDELVETEKERNAELKAIIRDFISEIRAVKHEQSQAREAARQ